MNRSRYLSHPVAATIAGVVDLRLGRRRTTRQGSQERVDGKTALVTGAASGLGFATAVDLARRGASVLMADCRGLVHAKQLAEQMSRSDRLEMLGVDLSDLDSIDRLCEELARRSAKLDILVLNAAIVPSELRRTKQGLNEMFVVNYFSSFVLLRRLLQDGIVANDVLATAPAVPLHKPRIVFVSSEAHRWAPDLDLQDIGGFPDYRLRSTVTVYGYYKLMLTTLAAELSRRLNPRGEVKVSVLALCPGAMNTNIIREAPRALKPLLRVVMRLFFQSPFEAAEPVVYLACAEAMSGLTGVYLHRMTRKEVDPRAADTQIGTTLWQQSEALLAELRAAPQLSELGSLAAAP